MSTGLMLLIQAVILFTLLTWISARVRGAGKE
jgi:hypothetical protein